MFDDSLVDGHHNKFDDPQDRLGFIRKVYLILTTQLLFTGFMCIIPMVNENAQNWMMKNYWLLIVCCIGSIVLNCVLICIRSVARSVPINYILLFAFTFCQGYMVASICAMTSPQIVLAAAFMTAAITISLTIYAWTTKTDFTVLGGMFFILGAALFMLGIFCLFVKYNALHMVYCSIAVVLFGLYLVFDTQLIVGGKRHKLDIDEYIVGALILYADIIMIFVYLIRILGDR